MTTAGKRILKSAKQALAFAEGKEDHGCTVHIPEEINVRRIRKKLDMSQKAFAEYFGVNLRTVQDWEQGRRVPSGASRNFLFVIDREPEAVRRVLVSP
ncbi:MAG: helix-turn-helix domain-containing protein [Deltaproteobacteria bacterium]|nr:helix-turn-helix domain-containing protein [Deltaproteobacteria bacterium]